MYHIDIAPVDDSSMSPSEASPDFIVASTKTCNFTWAAGNSGADSTFSANIYTTTSGFTAGDDLMIRI